MKKLNLLPIFSSVIAAPAIIVPIASCSCTVTKVLDLSDVTIGQDNVFGLTGNFNKGTVYNYRGKLQNWTTDFGKPTEANWNKSTIFGFGISKQDGSDLKLTATDNVKIICDGNTLKKGSVAEVTAGTADWCYSDEHINSSHHLFMIRNTNGLPVKYDSTIVLEGVQFESTTENVKIGFGTILS